MNDYQPDLENLSLQDCVRISGKSISTVRRRKQQLIELGATCSKSGWSVTIEQLAGAGLASDISPGRCQTDTPGDTSSDELIDTLKKQIQFLEEALERERLRADKAEGRLDRLLPPAPEPEPATPEPVSETPVQDQSVQPQRQGFFRRLFGG